MHVLFQKQSSPPRLDPAVGHRAPAWQRTREGEGEGRDRPTAPRPRVQPRNKDEVFWGSPAGVSGACPVILCPLSDFFRAPAHKSSTGPGPRRVLPLSVAASAAHVPSGEGRSSRGSRPGKHWAGPAAVNQQAGASVIGRAGSPDTSIGGHRESTRPAELGPAEPPGREQEAVRGTPAPPSAGPASPLKSTSLRAPRFSATRGHRQSGHPQGFVGAGTGVMKVFYPGG
ncbi:hypothetical protein NDU88_004877 [Pleurodeles waltl]|uniref:Uncharacterized protein n=1 Tax=Pleurodeles waltl TaxID=8319 RepID=A0AAV7WXX9_PLEWA|nr:hypothetical protein NDU88_004877 [Pleurodeles waltl]